MKIRIRANELVDGQIEFISLVKNGANRSPYKIVKQEQESQSVSWRGLFPELDKLADAFADQESQKEAPTVSVKKDTEVSEGQARALELRRERAEHESALFRLYEQANHPLFAELERDLNLRISKLDLQIARSDDRREMDTRSAFFFRGGQSIHSTANAIPGDSAYTRSVSKGERVIDLSTPITLTKRADEDDVDLNRFEI